MLAVPRRPLGLGLAVPPRARRMAEEVVYRWVAMFCHWAVGRRAVVEALRLEVGPLAGMGAVGAQAVPRLNRDAELAVPLRVRLWVARGPRRTPIGRQVEEEAHRRVGHLVEDRLGIRSACRGERMTFVIEGRRISRQSLVSYCGRSSTFRS